MNDLSSQVAMWRDCFAEITAKSTPFCNDTSDPERITAYIIPAGPLHRAAGKTGFQFWGGEQAAACWQSRAEALEQRVAALVGALKAIDKSIERGDGPPFHFAVTTRELIRAALATEA